MELDWKSNLIAAKKAKLSEDGSFWCWIEQTERFKSRSKERKRKKVCSLLSNIEKHEGKIIEKRRKKDIWQTADGKKRELINQRDRKPRPSGWNLKIFECKAQKMKTAKSPLDHRFFLPDIPFHKNPSSHKRCNMTQLLLLGKFEYDGGPIFKVVLEC